jgi:hypothetical protein
MEHDHCATRWLSSPPRWTVRAAGCWSSSRAFAEFRALGVRLDNVREGGQLPDFLVHVLGIVAQDEADRTGRRIKAVRDRKLARGWYVNGTARWGYRFRPRTPTNGAAPGPGA